MNRKTVEQERAYYCRLCVERLRLAKSGKWFDLPKEGNEYVLQDLLPTKFDIFYEFRLYDGVRKELYKGLYNDKNWKSWFKDKLSSFNDQEKGKINEFLNGKEDALDEFLKNKILEYYKEYEPYKKLNYLSDYSSHAKRLPQMIISNGLIPTLAFYKSKGKDRGQIYGDIDEIMEIMFEPYKVWKNNKKGYLLLEYLPESDFNILRLATVEALAIAEWLKRIVEVEIEDE